MASEREFSQRNYERALSDGPADDVQNPPAIRLVVYSTEPAEMATHHSRGTYEMSSQLSVSFVSSRYFTGRGYAKRADCSVRLSVGK